MPACDQPHREPWEHACPPWRLVQRKLSDLKIPPDIPRAEPGEVDDLAASIREHGLLVPALIEADGTVRGGVRRLAALRSLGRGEAECLIIPPSSDPALVQLVDNLQREDLSRIEEARAFRRVLDRTGWKQVRLAHELGVSEARVSLALNLVGPDGAPREVLEAIERGQESAYAVECAFSRAGRRDGRAEEITRRARSVGFRTGPDGKGLVHARFSHTAVRVPKRRLPEGVRARVFTDRVELTFTVQEDAFPLERLGGPGGLAEALRAVLGPAEGDVTAALVEALLEARSKALGIDGFEDDGER